MRRRVKEAEASLIGLLPVLRVYQDIKTKSEAYLKTNDVGGIPKYLSDKHPFTLACLKTIAAQHVNLGTRAQEETPQPTSWERVRALQWFI